LGAIDVGLESVEFVMEVEEEFGLKIPDSDAEKLETIGLLHAYIVQRAGNTLTSEVAWDRIKRIFVQQHKIKPEDVQPHMRFVHDLGFD